MQDAAGDQQQQRAGDDAVPASSAAVSDHWALESETESAAATEGRSGAPRLLMIETTSVTPTSTGRKDRPAVVGGANPDCRLTATASP